MSSLDNQEPGVLTRNQLDRDMWLSRLSRRVQSEYEEMPGLSLTPRQAAHLWGVSAKVSEQVLKSLVETGYLREASTGFVRAFGRTDREANQQG